MLDRTYKAESFIQLAVHYAVKNRKEYVTPEMVLSSFFTQREGKRMLKIFNVDSEELVESFRKAFSTVDVVPKELGDYELVLSDQLVEVLANAEEMALSAGKSVIDTPHIINAILTLEDSYAKNIITSLITDDKAVLMTAVISVCQEEDTPWDHIDEDDIDDADLDEDDLDMLQSFGMETDWHSLCTCVNDILDLRNPLIGREEELQRTIEVLCRKEKNNPLHVGEPGVGKTALVYGLAEKIKRDEVPMRLRGAKIYMLDMGTLVAGTQYRGEFEKRIKNVMKGAEEEGNTILYIDEIHTLIGAGGSGDALDASNMLKPYLEGGKIRFIGATTYQEYNRYFQKNKSIVRRFQQIDVLEPSVDETIAILNGLREKYEKFHNVTYSDDVIRYAVEASAKYISDRFLPDKAIDLIDETGAKAEARMTGNEDAPVAVTKALIDEVLAKICKIAPAMLKDDDDANLETLQERITEQIYGQDDAVKHIVEAVQMGKAGLLDDDKPVASLLFVGPTGVGKTEVCRVLAKEMGIELVRFDMSEYAEKHTVAKLIGSPAGYVGYEEGGLLTDAIRKTPHCVLLLDEIEKAHADIYNILLQVMDYARLTDNKGQKADFRHVVLIMTSNAGAQFAHQAKMGFNGGDSAGDAMLHTVKKTFKPEFLARLSDTVVFNDMDRHMASLILKKKLRQLSIRLALKNVTMEVAPSAFDFLLSEGFSKKMGAREMDRKINHFLSPLLMKEILFGALKHGGHVTVEMQEKAQTLRLIHNS